MPAPYHLTIIGTRFPQLALGTLLAKRGRRVLIVDTLGTESASENSGIEGYRFRKRPIPMCGLDTGGFLRMFLNEIGIGRVLVNETYPLNEVSYQVVLPRHRLNIYPERDRLLAEISREFPENLDTIRELYEEWDTIASNWYGGQDNLEDLEKGWLQTAGITQKLKGFFHARKMGDKIRSFDTSSPEYAFFSLQHQFLGAFSPTADIPPLPGALIHSVGRRGTYQETTGTGGLTTLMLQRFQEYGGELENDTQVSSIDINSREGLSLELSNGQRVHTRTISTTAGIAATIDGLLQKIPTMPLKGPSPIHPVRFYLGIEDRIVPEAMEDNLFLMREDGGGPLKIKSCYLALSPAGSDMAPEGKRSITVTSLLSQEELKNIGPDDITAIREDLLQALEAVIPFLSEGLTAFSSDLDPDDEYRISRALPTGVAAWSPGIIGRMAITTRFRGRASIISPTPWELGIEGEALAALAAAGTLKKALGVDI
ncbi:glycosyltransferase [bacterium]|nr:glycosyltransferase [bacterium]